MDSARVYEGQYGSTSVAIKINKVPFGVDEESTDVFLKEMAILLAGQNHPNGSTSPFVHIPHFASRVFIESGSFYIAFRRPCFGTPLLSVFVDCFLLSTFVPVTLPPPLSLAAFLAWCCCSRPILRRVSFFFGVWPCDRAMRRVASFQN